MNINYGLFPELEGRVKKKERRTKLAERALTDLAGWQETINSTANSVQRTVKQ
jgi:methylenetetrahydrofolate--tRNA-(uracil-5-)-methyltransferase